MSNTFPPASSTARPSRKPFWPSAARRSKPSRRRAARPGLAVVLVGDNPASRSYVRAKDRMCQKIGMHSVKLELPAETTQSRVARRGRPAQRRPGRPRHPRAIAAAETHRRGGGRVLAIDPAKDVDGFHPVNVGKLAVGDPSGFVPCTPLGCQRLLIEAGVETAGARVVMLGRQFARGKTFRAADDGQGPGRRCHRDRRAQPLARSAGDFAGADISGGGDWQGGIRHG